MGGDMNDFYFEVAVRVVELCRETRSENGGLIGVEECRRRVGKGRAIGSGLEVTEYASSPVRSLKTISNMLTWQGRHPPRRKIPRTPRLRFLHHLCRQQAVHSVGPQRAQHGPGHRSRSHPSFRLRQRLYATIESELGEGKSADCR